MKKIFENLNISWFKLIIFSILIGIYTGLVMCVPFLKETSFQDIGISYECWVLFAVIIVVNSKKWYEATLKCFIFFLISQPVVYLTEIAAGHLSFEMGLYYYKTIWLPATFLTLPGGLIAYFCKKQNILGGIILGLGNTILMAMGVYYFLVVLQNFPYHLLTTLFCFGAIVIMTLCIQKEKLNRIISFIVPVILTAFLIILTLSMGLTIV